MLSTFQPGTDDPTEGSWETFTKYGKLGPDFGLDNVFKRPLVLFRPGACFVAPPRPHVGRAIPMEDMLSPEVCNDLIAEQARPVHFAFGLCVPLKFPTTGQPGSQTGTPYTGRLLVDDPTDRT